MSVVEQLEIKVNGVETTGLRLQRLIVDGYPTNAWEVLVEDPVIGYFPLDEKPDFIIEIKDPLTPVKKRTWKKVTLPELIAWLQNLGVIR